MIIVMYFVGLLTGLGIWFLTHCIRSEPQVKVKRGIIHQRLANQGQLPLSRRAPPKPPHNPCK